MSNYAFEYEMEVRDYELDFQGVVNNSNYQHYLEHARHQFLKTRGGSMSALHDAGVDPMVSKISIEYKRPLRGGDSFVVGVNMLREGAKLVFVQDIHNLANDRLVVKARGEMFDEVFKDFFK